MSDDQIRSHKAHALLEVQEAQETVDRLSKEAKWLGAEFQSFGTQLAMNPVATLQSSEDRFSHLTATAAYEIARKLDAATKRLAELTNKKALLFSI